MWQGRAVNNFEVPITTVAEVELENCVVEEGEIRAVKFLKF